MKSKVPVIAGKQRDKNPRLETGVFKYPEALKTEIERIAGKEHRSASSVIYFLLTRGVKAYNNDGIMIEDTDNELEFLEKKRA